MPGSRKPEQTTRSSIANQDNRILIFDTDPPGKVLSTEPVLLVSGVIRFFLKLVARPMKYYEWILERARGDSCNFFKSLQQIYLNNLKHQLLKQQLAQTENEK